MECVLRDGENYFYFWLQQHIKHSDLQMVPFPNKEEKLWGGGKPQNETFFLLLFSLFLQQKVTLNSQNFGYFGYGSCLLTSSGFQCPQGVRKEDEREVQDEGML